ncbi:MAG: hypothetical protein ISN64_01255 [Rickettsia sp.]|nr:hypothetical protein [Rickettsia sp.]
MNKILNWLILDKFNNEATEVIFCSFEVIEHYINEQKTIFIYPVFKQNNNDDFFFMLDNEDDLHNENYIKKIYKIRQIYLKIEKIKQEQNLAALSQKSLIVKNEVKDLNLLDEFPKLNKSDDRLLNTFKTHLFSTNLINTQSINDQYTNLFFTKEAADIFKKQAHDMGILDIKNEGKKNGNIKIRIIFTDQNSICFLLKNLGKSEIKSLSKDIMILNHDHKFNIIELKGEIKKHAKFLLNNTLSKDVDLGKERFLDFFVKYMEESQISVLNQKISDIFLFLAYCNQFIEKKESVENKIVAMLIEDIVSYIKFCNISNPYDQSIEQNLLNVKENLKNIIDIKFTNFSSFIINKKLINNQDLKKFFSNLIEDKKYFENLKNLLQDEDCCVNDIEQLKNLLNRIFVILNQQESTNEKLLDLNIQDRDDGSNSLVQEDSKKTSLEGQENVLLGNIKATTRKIRKQKSTIWQEGEDLNKYRSLEVQDKANALTNFY